MSNHPDTHVSTSGRTETRRAENYASVAMVGLAVGAALTSLFFNEPRIPFWVWAALLVVWFVTIWLTVNMTNRAGQLVFYGCAILSSWALILTSASPAGLLPVLLVIVAAIGAEVIAMRWVVVVSVLNCLMLFGHSSFLTGDLMNAAASAGFYLILHLAMSFTAYASVRDTQLRAELQQKNLELEAAAVLLEDSAASAERVRISRELHDLIGHQLTVLNLELEAAKHREGEQARDHVDQAADVAKDLLANVRTTVGELRQDGTVDLQQSLERLAGTVLSLEIHIEVDPEVQADEETSTTLVRAAQEIITNTIKHAEATELALTVTLAEGTLTLTGTNDGPAPRTITPGHGLTGLRERLELLGGTLDISTEPHFTVKAHLPMTCDRQLQR